MTFKTLVNTVLSLMLIGAGAQVWWALSPPPSSPQPVPQQLTVIAAQEPPVVFDEAYKRYVDHVLHTKYKDRLPLETERLERHLSIIKEQLEVQRRIIEEARRP